MIQIVRVQFNGRIPAFQAGRVGSIPITRSILLCACSSVGQSNCLLSSGSGVRISSGAPFIKQGGFSSYERQMNAGFAESDILRSLPQTAFYLVGIVQLVRASVCGTECRGFESHYPPHLIFSLREYRDIAKSVRHQILILAFRRFESCYPCHIRTISSGGRALDF